MLSKYEKKPFNIEFMMITNSKKIPNHQAIYKENLKITSFSLY